MRRLGASAAQCSDFRSIGGVSAVVWRLTTAAIAAVLVIYGATCPLRRPAIVPDALPSRRWVAIACLSLVVIAALVGNVIGVPCRPAASPLRWARISGGNPTWSMTRRVSAPCGCSSNRTIEYSPSGHRETRHAWTMRRPGTSSMLRPVMIPPKQENAPPARGIDLGGRPAGEFAEAPAVEQRRVDPVGTRLDGDLLPYRIRHRHSLRVGGRPRRAYKRWPQKMINIIFCA
jgi:hypothetical protein